MLQPSKFMRILFLLLFISTYSYSQTPNHQSSVDNDIPQRKRVINLPDWANEYDEVYVSDDLFICKKIINMPVIRKTNDTIYFKKGYLTYLHTKEGVRLSRQPYDDISAFSNGFARVVQRNPDHDGRFDFLLEPTRMGLIDRSGHLVIPLIYRDVWYFREGLVYVVDSTYNKGYFVDANNRRVFEKEFSPYHSSNFQNGICHVRLGHQQYNFINHKGEYLIPKVYDFIELPGDWNAKQVVAKNGKYGLLGEKAKLLLTLSYDLIDTSASTHWNGLYQTKFNNKYGYVDVIAGKEVIKPDYQDFIHTPSSKIWAKKNNKWGLLQKNNKLIYPLKADSILSIKDDYSIVQEGTKRGVVDSTGKIVVPVTFDNVSPFYEDVAIVVQDNRIGYVTRSGKTIASPQYISGTYFRNGKATVKTFFRHFTIDKNHTKLEQGFNSIVYVIGIGTMLLLYLVYFFKTRKSYASQEKLFTRRL